MVRKSQRGDVEILGCLWYNYSRNVVRRAGRNPPVALRAPAPFDKGGYRRDVEGAVPYEGGMSYEVGGGRWKKLTLWRNG